MQCPHAAHHARPPALLTRCAGAAKLARSGRSTRAGNVVLFEAVEAGQPFRLYDSDGNLVARDRGSIRHSFLFDSQGDHVPGGIYLDEFRSKTHGLHPGFDNFCELVTPLIGT